MSAKATGAAPNGAAGGNSKNRSHHDGSEGRAFTVEQKAAVVRVRRCGPTAFYDILGLEAIKTTVDDAGIKKAYRKLSLLTHPDKNGYEGADEAFKMVSRAFQILSDPDKKKRYDQFGGDPDNRFSSASAGASPFSGFARSPGSARGAGSSMFEEEISPEELFRQFFGGGLGGGFGGPFGGGLFDTGPGFVFNVGGGPGIRVHQFGGGRPRRRPAGARGADEQPSASGVLQNFLPLIILFVIPFLSSLLSSGGSFFSTSGMNQQRMPSFTIDSPSPPYTEKHTTENLKVRYYVNPADVEDFGPKTWHTMSQVVDHRHLSDLNHECDLEIRRREQLLREAQGWFFVDSGKIDEARALELKSCNKLNSLTNRRY